MGAKTGQIFIVIVLSAMVVIGIWSISDDNAYAKTPIETFTPTKLNATAISPTQITLSWIPPTQNYGKIITGYKIEKMLGNGVFDTIVVNTQSTFPNYSVTGLDTGKTYTFRVSAVYSDSSTSDPSNWASSTPTVTSVPPPSIGTSQGMDEKLDYTPADGTTLYGVVITQIDYRQLLDKKEPRSIISSNTQTSEAINTDLNGLLRYESQHQISPTVPAPLVAAAVSPTQIDLSWLPPQQSYGQVIIGYKIEWKQAPGAYITIEDNTRDVSTKYSISGLTTGTTYTYRVSAVYASDTTSNPSNEASATPLASLQPGTSNTQTGNSGSTPNNTISPIQNTTPGNQSTNVEFDFTPEDGITLSGVVLTQSEYQQLIVIKDPRSIISNVTQTANTINNDLSGILKYQGLHTPQQGQQVPTNFTQAPTPRTGLDITLVYGVITSVVASGAVGIVTWLVRTKVARKIAREYNFTIEKFIDDGIYHIRIRNSGQTIENCIISCDNKVCFWKDTELDKPRHVFEGSSSVAKLPDGFENTNPVITVKSGKKILRKTKLDEMAHGSKIDESSDAI